MKMFFFASLFATVMTAGPCGMIGGCKSSIFKDNKSSDNDTVKNSTSGDNRPTEDNGDIPGYSLVCGPKPTTEDNDDGSVGCRLQDNKTLQKAALRQFALHPRWSFSPENLATGITSETLPDDAPDWHVIYHVMFSRLPADFTFEKVNITFEYEDPSGAVPVSLSKSMQTVLARAQHFSVTLQDVCNKNWSNAQCLPYIQTQSPYPGYNANYWYKNIVSLTPTEFVYVSFFFHQNSQCSDPPIAPAGGQTSFRLPLVWEGADNNGALLAHWSAQGGVTRYLQMTVSGGNLYLRDYAGPDERQKCSLLLMSPYALYVPSP